MDFLPENTKLGREDIVIVESMEIWFQFLLVEFITMASCVEKFYDVFSFDCFETYSTVVLCNGSIEFSRTERNGKHTFHEDESATSREISRFIALGPKAVAYCIMECDDIELIKTSMLKLYTANPVVVRFEWGAGYLASKLFDELWAFLISHLPPSVEYLDVSNFDDAFHFFIPETVHSVKANCTSPFLIDKTGSLEVESFTASHKGFACSRLKVGEWRVTESISFPNLVTLEIDEDNMVPEFDAPLLENYSGCITPSLHEGIKVLNIIGSLDGKSFPNVKWFLWDYNVTLEEKKKCLGQFPGLEWLCCFEKELDFGKICELSEL